MWFDGLQKLMHADELLINNEITETKINHKMQNCLH